MKRKTALAMLHRLRSIAHVVDMHQLTKDPEHAMREVPRTASSPVRAMRSTTAAAQSTTATSAVMASAVSARSHQMGWPSCSTTRVFSSETRISSLATCARPESGKRSRMRCESSAMVLEIGAGLS